MALEALAELPHAEDVVASRRGVTNLRRQGTPYPQSTRSMTADLDLARPAVDPSRCQ